MWFVTGKGGSGKSFQMLKGAFARSELREGQRDSYSLVLSPTLLLCQALNEQIMRENSAMKHSVAEPAAITYELFIRQLEVWTQPRSNVLRCVMKETHPRVFKALQKCWSNRATLCLFCDEAPMKSRETFQKIDRLLRKNQRLCTTLPFAGVKLFLHGDFLQLPSPSGNPLMEGEWFLDLRKKGMVKTHILTENYRVQKTDSGAQLVELCSAIRRITQSESGIGEVMFLLGRRLMHGLDSNGKLSEELNMWLHEDCEKQSLILASSYQTCEQYNRELIRDEFSSVYRLIPPEYDESIEQSQTESEPAYVGTLCRIRLRQTLTATEVDAQGEKPRKRKLPNGTEATLVDISCASGGEAGTFVDVRIPEKGGATATITLDDEPDVSWSVSLYTSKLTIRSTGSPSVRCVPIIAYQGQTHPWRMFIATGPSKSMSIFDFYVAVSRLTTIDHLSVQSLISLKWSPEFSSAQKSDRLLQAWAKQDRFR